MSWEDGGRWDYEHTTRLLAIFLLVCLFAIAVFGILIGIRKMNEADRFEATCNRAGGRVVELNGRKLCGHVEEIKLDFGR